MKKIYLIFLVSLISQLICAQVVKFEWVKQFGSRVNDFGNSIITDASGNIYSTGIYQSTVDFDPGAGTYNLSSSGNAIFILKLDSNSNFIWAKSVNGSFGREEGWSITIDASGNVCVTGTFMGVADFDPSTATFNLTSKGLADVFILKLDSNGNFKWAKSMGGPSNDYCRSITTDLSNNVYITGSYSDTVDFDPDTTTYNLISNGSTDIFIQKLDSNGNFIWAKSMGGRLDDGGISIINDGFGNVFTTGYYKDSADFNPGSSKFLMTSKGNEDTYIQKLDSSGNFIWAKSIGGSLRNAGMSIVTDDSGYTYITGYYEGIADFDPSASVFNLNSNGNYDLFILKLDVNGNFVWVNTIVTNYYNIGLSIAIDPYRKLYVTGRMKSDIFIHKLDFNGNTEWTKIMGGIGFDNGQSITIDNFGNIYTIGIFSSLADFDPDTTIYNLTTNGAYDIFIVKLSQCKSNVGRDIISSCDPYKWIDGITYTASNNTATHSLKNVDGCDSIVTLNLTIDTVDVSITQAGSIITSNALGASYQWLNCSNNFALINGAIAQSFTASTNGDFAVEVTINSCIDTSKCINISTLGIEINTLFNRVSYYPNPTKGLVNLDFEDLNEVSLKVFSISGQLIYHQENIKTFTHQFELKAVPGLYFIELSVQSEKQHYKLVKK